MNSIEVSQGRPKGFRRFVLRTIDVILLLSAFALMVVVFFLLFAYLPDSAPSDNTNSPLGNALACLFAGFLAGLLAYNILWSIIKWLWRHDQVFHYKTLLSRSRKETKSDGDI